MPVKKTKKKAPAKAAKSAKEVKKKKGIKDDSNPVEEADLARDLDRGEDEEEGVINKGEENEDEIKKVGKYAKYGEEEQEENEDDVPYGDKSIVESEEE